MSNTFVYNSICPAISIILSDTIVVNTIENRKNLLEWLNNLLKIFNIITKNEYIINENDLNDPNKIFLQVFKKNLWPYSIKVLNSPILWGPYIWALLHAISVLWTKDNTNYISYLFKNISNILPCEKCKIDYIKNFDDELEKELNNINSLDDSVNFIINLRKKINNKNYCPTQLLNYLNPTINLNLLKNKKKCNCRRN